MANNASGVGAGAGTAGSADLALAADWVALRPRRAPAAAMVPRSLRRVGAASINSAGLDGSEGSDG